MRYRATTLSYIIYYLHVTTTADCKIRITIKGAIFEEIHPSYSEYQFLNFHIYYEILTPGTGYIHDYRPNNEPTPWGRALLAKVTVTQLRSPPPPIIRILMIHYLIHKGTPLVLIH